MPRWAGGLWDLYRLDLLSWAWDEVSVGTAVPPRSLFGIAGAGRGRLLVFGGSTVLPNPASFGTAGSLNDLYEVSYPTPTIASPGP